MQQFSLARQPRLWAALVVALLGLAGCAGDGDPAPVAAPTATLTSTPLPTDTPTPSHTATLPPTSTSTPLPSATPTSTLPPTSSPTPSQSPTVTGTATASPSSTSTPTITPPGSPAPTLPTSRTGLYVGVAKRDISPSGPVNLGGYGLGPGRRSTGVLAPIHVRAFVVSDGTHTIAFAQNETQGTFAAYKKGPWGLTDTRQAVAAATSGAIPADHIVISSDHSHAGPDTSGVWGGLSNTYMTFIKDQTVGAIVDAWNAMKPAQLLVGNTDASELLHSQFGEPPNDVVDGELRVLVAADPDDAGKVQTILVNYAAHATVMGSDNLLVSSDWPGVAATLVEAALGVDTAVVMVADIGRTQPSRDSGNTNPEKLQNYSALVADKVQAATTNLRPITGNSVAATQLFLRDTYANEVIEFSFLLALISRSANPPWLVNTDVGTLTSALRIGDVLFTSIPGEGYPSILFELQQRVPAQEHFIFGLANDQLGYLIAPQEGYPQVKAASPDNDNAIFNLSPSIGDHVMCTLFKAVRQLSFAMPLDPDKCATWSGEDNRLPY